jgi:hypothetical protein
VENIEYNEYFEKLKELLNIAENKFGLSEIRRHQKTLEEIQNGELSIDSSLKQIIDNSILLIAKSKDKSKDKKISLENGLIKTQEFEKEINRKLTEIDQLSKTFSELEKEIENSLKITECKLEEHYKETLTSQQTTFDNHLKELEENIPLYLEKKDAWLWGPSTKLVTGLISKIKFSKQYYPLSSFNERTFLVLFRLLFINYRHELSTILLDWVKQYSEISDEKEANFHEHLWEFIEPNIVKVFTYSFEPDEPKEKPSLEKIQEEIFLKKEKDDNEFAVLLDKYPFMKEDTVKIFEKHLSGDIKEDFADLTFYVKSQVDLEKEYLFFNIESTYKSANLMVGCLKSEYLFGLKALVHGKTEEEKGQIGEIRKKSDFFIEAEDKIKKLDKRITEIETLEKDIKTIEANILS